MVTATLTATATGKAQDTITLEGRNYTEGSNIPLRELGHDGHKVWRAKAFGAERHGYARPRRATLAPRL